MVCLNVSILQLREQYHQVSMNQDLYISISSQCWYQSQVRVISHMLDVALSMLDCSSYVHATIYSYASS